MPLYVDEQERPVTTNSMLRTFRRCPKAAEYKYHQRLKPRVAAKPLTRGKWLHHLFEAHYSGRDWREIHEQLSAQYDQLFDEEKERLGDLPEECARIMRSYLWHYGANKDDPMHGWKIIQVEAKMEAELPNGTVFRIKFDLLIEDQYGLWLVDHKTHKSLPSLNYRLLDSQSGNYIWVARKNGLDIQGFIWNYVRTKPPTKPEAVYHNTRLSRRAIETDYPTLLRAIREYGFRPSDYKDQLLALQRQRWQPDTVQTSQFFRRETLEKDPAYIRRVLLSSMRTSRRMHAYKFGVESVERVPERSCDWCDYKDICTVELMGGSSFNLRRSNFKVSDDVLDYHEVNERLTD